MKNTMFTLFVLLGLASCGQTSSETEVSTETTDTTCVVLDTVPTAVPVTVTDTAN